MKKLSRVSLIIALTAFITVVSVVQFNNDAFAQSQQASNQQQDQPNNNASGIMSSLYMLLLSNDVPDPITFSTPSNGFTYIVPAGVDRIEVVAIGASGGNSASASGGQGG